MWEQLECYNGHAHRGTPHKSPPSTIFLFTKKEKKRSVSQHVILSLSGRLDLSVMLIW